MKKLKEHKTFDGSTQFWSHSSQSTKTEMKFATFIPNGKVNGCVIWLSGLTCNEENFITKAGAQKYLAAAGFMVLCPDTSPRGLNLPGEHDSYDFGSGAGFYVDATTEAYKEHYRMYSYVTDELYEIIQRHFKQDNISIMGHSMGGHGALVIGLRNPQKFKVISAFAPIVNPCQSAWGVKAFSGYLGPERALWKEYDACELIKAEKTHPNKILIHQGTSDEFLEKQLLIENLVKVCESTGQKLEIKYAEGYDHSYYFISTFIDEHVRFHKEFIKKNLAKPIYTEREYRV
ncbi:MAG: S-formylglutathione hydrolase [Candidatus Caenarcaniphilales bacterium]|nr:S-formylglutathione hydrolase [Candidatus Caenarcaniphilales bacterium]